MLYKILYILISYEHMIDLRYVVGNGMKALHLDINTIRNTKIVFIFVMFH